jgi:hypothetical protein
VAVYLQNEHDYIFVNRGRATVGYEYVLRHRRSGARAVATVKSGGERVDLDALPRDPDIEVWAYAVTGEARGKPLPAVHWITTDDLIDFMNRRMSIPPDQVVRWLTHLRRSRRSLS